MRQGNLYFKILSLYKLSLSELKTLEQWISRLMLKLLVLLNPRLFKTHSISKKEVKNLTNQLTLIQSDVSPIDIASSLYLSNVTFIQ